MNYIMKSIISVVLFFVCAFSFCYLCGEPSDGVSRLTYVITKIIALIIMLLCGYLLLCIKNNDTTDRDELV